MPGSFSGFGVHFLYPENWKIAEQTDEDRVSGVTLETPDGAFFSVNRYIGLDAPEKVVEHAVSAMREEYDQVEQNLYRDPQGSALESGADLNFYYLDLLISARMLAIPHQGDMLLVQLQGESRDFDRLEPIFAAMLTSLRSSLSQTDEV